MLKLFRKKTKTIIWLTVITFILGGGFIVGTSFQKKEAQYAGNAFGKNISYQEFNRFYRSAQIFTDREDLLTDSNLARQKAWQELIYAREAKHRKIDVSDDEVRTELKRLLASFDITNPTPEVYNLWLERTVRMSPQEFEGMLREKIRVQKLVQGIMTTPVELPTEEEILRAFQLSNNKIRTDIAEFTTEEAAASFIETVSEKGWEAMIQDSPESIKSTGQAIALSDFAELFRLPPALALKIHTLPLGTTSEPFKKRDGLLVVRVLEITSAPAEELNAEVREQLMTKIGNERRLTEFLKWNFSVMTRADLKDYVAEAQEEARKNR